MIIKAIEIRDRNTFIAAAAIKMAPENEGQRYLLRRCGWSADGSGVVLIRLDSAEGKSDPYEWVGSRTMTPAHAWCCSHFDEIKDGDVVDVEFLLGEAPAPKLSERADVP